jgi:hypothetical protein
MHRPLRVAARAATLALVLAGSAAVPAAAQQAPPTAPPAPPATTPAPPTTTTPATPPAPDVPRPVPTSPTAGAREFAGQDDRWTVGGAWLIRRDQGNVGMKEGWQRRASPVGWTAGTVPNVWNAGDNSPESQAGGITWYRRELRLPRIPEARKGGAFVLRFERVAVAAQVWVDGEKIGSHRGAYEPFELRIPAKRARDGKVTLVVRTTNVRNVGDFPPASRQRDGTPGGGWWNDGGIPREVVLRYADGLDLSPVQITPDLPCADCSGVLRVRTTVTNVASGTRRARVQIRVGNRVKRLGDVRLKGGETRNLEGRMSVPDPIVWTPKKPTLYTAGVEARLTSGKREGERVARYRVRTGIRSVKVVKGHLQLNFRDVNLRGSGLHEMDIPRASAMTNRGQNVLLEQVRDLGGLVLRAHYPLHPRILEEADRMGLLVWSEIPVYQVRQSQLARPSVLGNALELLESMIVTNAHHPSVFTWSVGNELTTNPGKPIVDYFKATRKVVDELDRSRPMSYARQSGVRYGCVGAYGPVDLLGLNDYFGWYGAPNDPLSNPAELGPFLDRLRACNPREAIMITETGAEANHDGPVTDAGTYAFQAAYAAHHFGVYRSKPWLSGAIWWGLREFRVRPNWAGGNPLPTPPWHGKGLLGRDFSKKPAWTVLRDEFRSVDQLSAPSTAPVTIPPSPPGRSSAAGTGEDGDPAAAPGDGAATPGA